jgi:hypothetical protein
LGRNFFKKIGLPKRESPKPYIQTIKITFHRCEIHTVIICIVGRYVN